MAPKPKPVPKRLGPPPQLSQFSKIPIVHQQKKLQPKMMEIFSKQMKMIARWMHVTMTWKKILMSWMVLLVASKMVLLMLTYEFFSLTALISLQIFHGVWTIAFFCLNVIDSRAILPNASCLLAGYLPATTVLHILLIPNDYPLEFIIIDAVGTFLAIITMFLLLRMECTEILHEAEELWQRQSGAGSDSGSEVGSVSSGTTADFNEHYLHASRLVSAAAAAQAAGQVGGGGANGSVGRQTPSPILQGSRVGPTIITVNPGVPSSASVAGQTAASVAGLHHNAAILDSMLYTSMDEPQSQASSSCNSDRHHHQFLNLYQAAAAASSAAAAVNQLSYPVAAAATVVPAASISGGIVDEIDDVVIFDEAVDLEPIDFEHFIDEPDLGRNRSERMFKVSFSDSSASSPSPSPPHHQEQRRHRRHGKRLH